MTSTLSKSSLPSSKKVNLNAEVKAEFDTDVVYEGLTFTKPGVAEISCEGMPNCMGGPCAWLRRVRTFCGMITSLEKHRVVIMDARKRNLDYEQTGFTLRPLKSTLRPLKSNVTDWKQVTLRVSIYNIFSIPSNASSSLCRGAYPLSGGCMLPGGPACCQADRRPDCAWPLCTPRAHLGLALWSRVSRTSEN